MSPADPGTELLVHYVRLALEQLARGEQVQPTQLCREHPHVAAPLAEALGLADALVAMPDGAVRGDPLAGHLLAGRYRLSECLGRGAMGVVYGAEDVELRRQVAVKILDARLFADPVAEQRFQREAETLAALRHPAVVAVHDRGRTPEGIHFLVMELLAGAPLSAVLHAVDDGGDPVAAVRDALALELAPGSWWRQCARWGAELADGLAAAHAAGIVHRDVKPSNVWIRGDGQPVLLDFGIAVRGSEAKLTATQTTLGTPWYMAPEQVKGGARGDPTLDVYGLCATLYHLLAMRPPYQGEPAQVLVQLQQQDPPPLRRLRPELPRDLCAVVERGMERDPRARYPGAAALAGDLRAFLEHRPVAARPIGWLGRRWRAARRRPARTIAVLTSAVAMVVLAVLAWTLHAEAERTRLQRVRELSAQLPIHLAVEGQPDQRLVEVLLPDQREATALLDRILELAPDDLPVRLFRAGMRLDAGEAAAAAADLEHVAQNRDSAYLRALAERYRAVPAGGKGTEVVDVGGLPEPDGPEACFVAGFHELRNRHVSGFAERAAEWLGRVAADYVPARDLRTIALLAQTDALPAFPQRAPLFQEVYDESLRLEAIYRQPTARVLAVRGTALVGLRRYEEAIAPLQQSLELRPGRHSPLINLGIALRRTARLQAAVVTLEEAWRLRPSYWNTPYTLSQVFRDLGDFAAARLWAERVPATGPGGLEWKQPDLWGNLELAEAMTHRGGDADAAAECARRAVAAFDRALAAAKADNLRQILEVRRAVAAALLADDLNQALVGLLRQLQMEPEDPYQIANLASLLPAQGLDPLATIWLDIWLRSLALKLAPHDPQLRARMQDGIQAALRRASDR